MPASHPTLGSKIRAWREIRGYTLRDLEKLSSISFSLISRYEKGRATPSYERSQRIAKALGIPVEDLWSHSPAPETRVPSRG